MKRKAKAIEQALRKLARSNGGLLRPHAVVAAAEPESSVLHACFEWDDSVAAHEYRLWQARQLIRVVVEVLPGMSCDTPVFVSLSSDRQHEGGYRVTATVASDAEMRAQMLNDAIAELRVFRCKYHQLQELVAVFSAAEKIGS